MEYQFEAHYSGDDGDAEAQGPRVKRRRLSYTEDELLEPLLDLDQAEDAPFDEFFEHLVDSYVQTRNQFVTSRFDPDPQGRPIRVMTPLEIEYHRRELLLRKDATESERQIAIRLKFIGRKPYAITDKAMMGGKTLEFRPVKIEDSAPPEVIQGLLQVDSTPYENSFASRLYGCQTSRPESACKMVDWDTRTVWMELCQEIHAHALLRNPPFPLPSEETYISSITYGQLESRDLTQVHDLLGKSFWSGIDVRESLDLEPEKTTVVVRYRALVVGAAFLSAPEEPYITYITVRPGWENAQIASNMLYLLVKSNPGRDITLHVSATNPALLLYNRFCFKAEEYVIGFYEDYLPPTSKASKNAFRIRLRQ